MAACPVIVRVESGESFDVSYGRGRLFVSSHGDPPKEIFAKRADHYFSALHDLHFAVEDGQLPGVVWTYLGTSEEGLPDGQVEVRPGATRR